MFSEIYTSRQNIPWQSYSMMFCSIMVTVATLVFPNLEHVFGSFDQDTPFTARFAITFQHGFDPASSIIHLVIDLVLFIMIGVYLEKVIGGWNFFILNMAAIMFSVLLHLTFNMIGHGATGLLFAYIPVAYYSISEGRILKTRSIFDEYYSTLRLTLLIMIVLIPILLSIIPIYFKSELPILQSLVFGNILTIGGFAMGVLFVFLFKNSIRARMKQFAKKKKFEVVFTDKYNLYLAGMYPLIIFLSFLLAK